MPSKTKPTLPTCAAILAAYGITAPDNADNRTANPFKSRAWLWGIAHANPRVGMLTELPDAELAAKLRESAGVATPALAAVCQIPPRVFGEVLEKNPKPTDELLDDEMRGEAPWLRLYTALVYWLGGTVDGEGRAVIDPPLLVAWSPEAPPVTVVPTFTPPKPPKVHKPADTVEKMNLTERAAEVEPA